MIIGENTDKYSGYEESYDYLFKKKQGAPTPRQQKKAERKADRKAGKPAPQPGSFRAKRQDKKAGIAPPKKRLIMGNFGLFNKNKKQEEAAKAAATAPPAIAPPEVDGLQDPRALAEEMQNQEMNVDAEMNPPAMPEEAIDPGMTDGAETEAMTESSYDEAGSAPQGDSKAPGKGKDKKRSLNLDWVGWTFLGLTVAGIGYLIYSMEKNKDTQLLETVRRRSDFNLK